MAYPGSLKAVPWQSTVPFSANESFDFMATFISFVLFLLFGGHPSMTMLGELCIQFIFNEGGIRKNKLLKIINFVLLV